MKIINSKNNPLIVNLNKLKDKKNRNIEHKFIIEGLHLVKEAYNDKCLLMVLSTDEELLKEFKVETILVNDEIIKKLSNTLNPQKIVGIAELKEQELTNDEKRIVLLDDIQDPGNMGTIIRTAAALGYDAVISSLNSVDYYNDKVIRSSQGAIFKIKILNNDLITSINQLKKLSFHLYGTSLKANILIENITKNEKLAVIFGNEAHGVSKDILDMCDELFKIEMKNNVESLNVAVTSAIILYELSK